MRYKFDMLMEGIMAMFIIFLLSICIFILLSLVLGVFTPNLVHNYNLTDIHIGLMSILLSNLIFWRLT